MELRVCKTVGETLRTEFTGLRTEIANNSTGLRTEFTGLRTEIANNSPGLRTELSAKIVESADSLRKTMKDREVCTHACEHSYC